MRREAAIRATWASFLTGAWLPLALQVRRGGGLPRGTVATAPRTGEAWVLGAMAPGGIPSAFLEDRLLAGHALLAAGTVQRLVLSGTEREVQVMARWYRERAIPDEAVRLDFPRPYTLESVESAAKQGVVNPLFVTQAFHLPRTLYLAAELGLHGAFGVAADARPYADLPRQESREWFSQVLAWWRMH